MSYDVKMNNEAKVSDAERTRKRLSKIKKKTSLGCKRQIYKMFFPFWRTTVQYNTYTHSQYREEAKPKEEFVIVVIVVMHK